jgi:3-oxoacyl-[acyl-carrier protein] reductase
MKLGLENKRAFVTAASRGLGRQSALALAGEGACVVVASRNTDALAELVEELKVAGAPEAIAVPVDLGDSATITEGVSEAVESFGGLDIVVGNTGGPKSGAFLDISRSDWNQAANETLFAMVELSRATVPHLQRAGGGRMIFVTTVGVKIVQPNMVLSDSLRLAIVGLAKSMSHELAGDGILVNCLCPGPVATDRMDDLISASMDQKGIDRAAAETLWLDEVPLGRFGDPEDFGALVAFLASNRAAFITGTAIAVDGGKSRAY